MATVLATSLPAVAPYKPSDSNPWNVQKVLHLYRRAGFGATQATIQQALQEGAQQTVSKLIDQAVAKAPTPAPYWSKWNREDFNKAEQMPFRFRRDWKNQMVKDMSENDLRDRLTLFWMNHFVTEDNVYNAPNYMFEYYNILQTYAIGNFKEFTHAIGISNAMLIYLNGFRNRLKKPNENYARELYELFTLGVNNGYDQNDIEETARALTGWSVRDVPWGDITFGANRFDNGEKTIFNQTGNWGYDDVIDILFRERADKIANFICGKLHTYFIGPTKDKRQVEILANIFIKENFELEPVLRELLSSEEFFAQANQGTIIKSPADMEVSFVKELELEYLPKFDIDNKIRQSCEYLGQELFSPIDVAGWEGNRKWVGSSTLTGRWERMGFYIWTAWRHNKPQFRELAKRVMNGNSNDGRLVSKTLIDHFMSRPLADPGEYEEGYKIFQDQVPENYFEDGTWNLDWDQAPRQVYHLLFFISRLPEFQLK